MILAADMNNEKVQHILTLTKTILPDCDVEMYRDSALGKDMIHVDYRNGEKWLSNSDPNPSYFWIETIYPVDNEIPLTAYELHMREFRKQIDDCKASPERVIE